MVVSIEPSWNLNEFELAYKYNIVFSEYRTIVEFKPIISLGSYPQERISEYRTIVEFKQLFQFLINFFLINCEYRTIVEFKLSF